MSADVYKRQQYGLLNYIIVKLGGQPIAWLSDPNTVKWAILIVLVWSMVSYQVIIMLAGLQGISKIYYEAAEIDGANKMQIFFKVTLPLLSPTIFFVTIMSMINILQIFDFIFLMIQRNTVAYQYSMSLVSYFYEIAFTQKDVYKRQATTRNARIPAYLSDGVRNNPISIRWNGSSNGIKARSSSGSRWIRRWRKRWATRF